MSSVTDYLREAARAAEEASDPANGRTVTLVLYKHGVRVVGRHKLPKRRFGVDPYVTWAEIENGKLNILALAVREVSNELDERV